MITPLYFANIHKKTDFFLPLIKKHRENPPPRSLLLSIVANYGHSTRRKPISLHR